MQFQRERRLLVVRGKTFVFKPSLIIEGASCSLRVFLAFSRLASAEQKSPMRTSTRGEGRRSSKP